MTINATNPTLAIVMVLTGMLILGVIDNTIRLIADTISLWQFHFMRSVLATSLLLGFMAVRKQRLTAMRWWAVFVRSGCLALAMVIYFGCLGFLPIADVVAGLFAAPVLVVVITAFFLKERIGWVRWLAAVVGFLGTLVVIKASAFPVQTANPVDILRMLPFMFADLSWWNLIPLVAALFYALGGIATRALCEGETTLSMLFTYIAMMGVIGALGLAVTGAVPLGESYLTRPWATPTPVVWGVLALQAVGSLIGVACLIRAYQLWQASYVAVFEYSLLIFASVFAWAMYAEAVSLPAYFGMALIVAAGAVIALRSSPPEEAVPGPRTSA